MLGITSWLALAGALTAETPTQHIYGGTDVVSCGWPTTVSMEGQCTGTLVHPQVVIYAQHCGSGYGQVTFGEDIDGSPGRSVPTEFCRTYPGGGPGTGQDFAFCVLAEPQNDIELVPILMGCETSVLTQGRQVVGVGFGEADTGPYGIKREVTMDFGFIDGNNEAFAGGGGEDTCQGDSGGPLFVQMPVGEGAGDGSWRVFGITSYGNACGGGGYYSMMHIGIEWFETESGFDLTPCHDVDGTWNPTPECGDFPLNPANSGGVWADGCNPGELGPLSAICGNPFDASSDMDPPTVAITTPSTGSMFSSDPMSGQATFPVVAEAADVGYGVDTVRLLINGMDVPGGELTSPPYAWNGGYPAGQYTFQAVATDVAGNVAESEIIYVGVDMDAPTPEPMDDSGSGSEGGSESGPGTSMGVDTEGDGTTDDDASASGMTLSGGQDDDPVKGCGCREGQRPASAAWGMLGLVGLLGLRRRRR
jgi:MYXO-CTERM domain-containing protein